MTPLRALVVEDSEDDALLLARELRRGGCDVTYERVETAGDMKAALESGAWDVVISDYSMPHFSAPGALRVLRETGLDLPFIIVSGTVGEDVAVEAMKAGAHDYILKGNLTRLGPAVRREIEQAANRKARTKAEAALKMLSRAIEHSPSSVVITDVTGTIEYVNPKFETLTGYTLEEVRGKNSRILKSGEMGPGVYRELWETITSGREWRGRLHNRRKGGGLYWESASIFPIFDQSGRVTHFVGLKEDITERERAEAQLQQLNRLFRTMSELSKAIVHTEERECLLSEACRVLVEHGGFRMAWIGIVDSMTSRVVPAARAGHGAHYLDETTVRCDDSPEGRGQMGTAIRTGKHVVVNDIAEDPANLPWRAQQLAAGFRAAGAFPLRVHGEVVGALKIYADRPHAIGEEETALLDDLAADLGHALA
ncbi:MAG TPA: PAS domain S-box protein, partial [Polyangiaceae bacterium]